MNGKGRDEAAVADRVRRSHQQTRVTLRFALAFIVGAAVASACDVGWWLPLHLFLAGAVVSAISAVSLMLTVTWSTAPAPSNRLAWIQRLCVAIGALGIGVGRNASAPDPVVGGAGAIYLAGLLCLAGMLAVTVGRGSKRRFDVAVASYVAAILAGVVGSAIGVYMAVTTASSTLRGAHVTANLLGLLGLVIGATLPFFASTVGRARMNPIATSSRLMLTLTWQVSAVATAIVLLAAGQPRWATIGFGAYALGIVATYSWMPRPTRRQLEWAGPRLLALWAGGLWWLAAIAATGVDLLSGRPAFDGRWMAVIAISAYGQILWGSLAYLLPMLRGGGHQLLGDGFAATRSWVGFMAVNAVGVALVGTWNGAATVAGAVWLLDSAVRAARVGTTRADRPSTTTSTGVS